jgi:hypothetical protein
MTDSLASALAKLQADLPRITKDAQGQRARYADLADITQALLPRLAKLGLVWTCCPTISDAGRFVLRYALIHAESGDEYSGEYPLAEGNPQQQGSEITYAKRYALCAVTGVAPDDDDDDSQEASGATETRPRTRTRIPGPDHERLRQDAAQGRVDGAERRTGPDPDDPWAAEGNAEPAEKQPGSGKPLMRKLQAAFTNAGITDRDVRLGIVAEVIDRTVGSANDLSYTEAEAVLAHLADVGQP